MSLPSLKCFCVLAHIWVLESIGNGYGFPSSHSQYMGYFTTFLTCHMFFRHRFATSGFGVFDQLWRICVYAGLLGWAGAVAYSRYVAAWPYWYNTDSFLLFMLQALSRISRLVSNILGLRDRLCSGPFTLSTRRTSSGEVPHVPFGSHQILCTQQSGIDVVGDS